MSKLETNTGAASLIIFALTLCPPNEPMAKQNTYSTTEMNKISCLETRNEEINYVDEQYTNAPKLNDIIFSNLENINLIDPNILPQTNLDADMLSILNKVDKVIGKKKPSKPRF